VKVDAKCEGGHYSSPSYFIAYKNKKKRMLKKINLKLADLKNRGISEKPFYNTSIS